MAMSQVQKGINPGSRTWKARAKTPEFLVITSGCRWDLMYPPPNPLGVWLEHEPPNQT